MLKFYPAALVVVLALSAWGESVFPGAHWEENTPEAIGMEQVLLEQLAAHLGGRGCVIRDGHLVKHWGNQAERGDWASSAKPVLSTLLFFAVEEGLVKNVDQPIAEFGWELKEKDKGITFRQLGAMMSGYARPEPAGAAWAYNDFAIQLYQKTLFDRVFKGDPKAEAEAPRRFGALGFEDGLYFDEGRRRMKASVRDFARIAWFWLNKGRWGEQQVLPARYFEEYMRPQAPKDLPPSAEAETDDYLGIGTYGGGSNHFADDGPGVYGFNWWFNDTGRLHPDAQTWPDAPEDTVMSIGVRGNCSAIIPSLNVALVCADGDWGENQGGQRDSKTNKILALLAKACATDKEARPEPIWRKFRINPDYRHFLKNGEDFALESSPFPPFIDSSGAAYTLAWTAGPRQQGHPLQLSIVGPTAGETGEKNIFTDYRMTVHFKQKNSCISVPGYYAADGYAADSGANVGNVWRTYFLPQLPGKWEFEVSMRQGDDIAISTDPNAGDIALSDGIKGSFEVQEADSAAAGILGRGLLKHEGERYLRFAGSGEYYLKGGADSPENFLAYYEFDQTKPSHEFAPHARDFRAGDPTWRSGRGRSIIGALNYLASKQMNVVYFLTMNVGGDGKDVWPWTSDDERDRYDCSKLDQWEIVFSHMDRLGILLHVVTQEQENDQLLDDGELGPDRKLYYRELIARFAHHPALVWNLGEENTNTTEQLKAYAAYIRALDPYDHPIVVHTFPDHYEQIYGPLLGDKNIDGASLQLGDMRGTYAETLRWVKRSAAAGKPWFVCLDEIGPPDTGVKPDEDDPQHNEVRQHALWGNLMAGGSGAEWLFGYKYAHNDINCEDWRSRDKMWDQTWYALEFFQRFIPFAEMMPAEDVIQGDGWCLAKAGEIYAVYTWNAAGVVLTPPEGEYEQNWYNPRAGGELMQGERLNGGNNVKLGAPPADADRDWAAVLRRVP
ncbi:MAG: DUF5060 domain-containing protein, partial [Candidatus Hydrogenedentes bacterium]|nr:DUF5060 domain-containing protein [Candidatus Hydrogenedentota bacterium]